ncbi:MULTISPECIES: chitin-binding domain-containing protein [Brucella]
METCSNGQSSVFTCENGSAFHPARQRI